jgi:formyltetrahydrofolate deformylase
MDKTAILLITCPDRKGLVARVSGMLYEHGANIVHADQHQDHEAGLFFMRVEWALEDFGVADFRTQFTRTADELNMTWRLEVSTEEPRVAIFGGTCLFHSVHREQP